MQKEKFQKDLEKLISRIRYAEPLEVGWKLQGHICDIWRKLGYNKLSVLITGSGNNYPAVLFAKHSCSDSFRTANVDALCTQDAIKKLKQFKHIVNCDYHAEYDVVIIVSYEGPTDEVRRIYGECMMCSSKPEIIILTGQREDSFDPNIYKYCKIFSYYNSEDDSDTEESTVPSFSTFISCAIFDDFQSSIPSTEDNVKALNASKEDADKIEASNIAKSIFAVPVVYVLHEWDTISAAYDIKNKFEKAGIAFVVLCNKKEFSKNADLFFDKAPGLIINLMRYQFAIQRNPRKVVYLDKTDYKTAVKEFLIDYGKKNSVPYLEIGSPAMMPMQCNIEIMAKFLYIFSNIWDECADYNEVLLHPEVDFELFEKMQCYEGEF